MTDTTHALARAVSSGYALGVALSGLDGTRFDLARYTGLLVEAQSGVDTDGMIDEEIRACCRLIDNNTSLDAWPSGDIKDLPDMFGAAFTAFCAVHAVSRHPDRETLFKEYLTAVIGGLHRKRETSIETVKRQNHPDHLRRIPDLAA